MERAKDIARPLFQNSINVPLPVGLGDSVNSINQNIYRNEPLY
jgi:hypothetical protein